MNREEALQWCVDNLERWPQHNENKFPRLPHVGVWGWSVTRDMAGVHHVFMDSSVNDNIGMTDWLDAKNPVGKRYHKFTDLHGDVSYVDFDRIELFTVGKVDGGDKITIRLQNFQFSISTLKLSGTLRVTQETINAFIEAWEAYTG